MKQKIRPRHAGLSGHAKFRHWHRPALPSHETSMTGALPAASCLAAQIMAEHTGVAKPDIEVDVHAADRYATPKLGVRGAVFRNDRVLLVREMADEHRWTLPGGWADVNESPADAVARRIREEAGFRVRPYKLAAVGPGSSVATE